MFIARVLAYLRYPLLAFFLPPGRRTPSNYKRKISQALAKAAKSTNLLLEPLLGVSLDNAVGETNTSVLDLAASNAGASAAKDGEEIHTVDTNGGVVLDTEIDVLLDTEAKVATVREVLGVQFVLLDLEAAVKQLHGLLATDGCVASDLFVTANAE